MAVPSWFERDVYFNNKLAQMQESSPEENWTAESLTKAFTDSGFSTDADGMYKHFNEYGNAENVSPNVYFVVDEYKEAKLAQLRADDPAGDWTMEKMEQAFEEAGLSYWDHYTDYGMYEGVSPSYLFSTNDYMAAKLAQLQRDDPSGNWTEAKMDAAFKEAGLNPIEHYFEYGKAEGVEYTPGPAPTPGGETFRLTTGQDAPVGTAYDDVFIANEFDGVNTLQSGDRVDGGAGTDVLYADLTAGSSFGQILNTVTPELANVEIVKFRSQQSTDGSTGTAVAAQVDAERISGMTELWSSNSRADLNVEDVRINSNALTVGFQNADSVANVSPDYTVQFNNQYLKADAAQTSGTLVLQLMDVRNAIDSNAPLEDNVYNVIKFGYNGELVTLEIDLVNGADATYQDLLNAINSALSERPELAGLSAALGDDFTRYDPLGTGQSATGQQIVITAANGELSDTVAGSGWDATGGVSPSSDLHTSMSTQIDTTCPLITTDIALDNVGMVEWNNVTTCIPDNQQFGDNAGDMTVGGTGNGDYVGVQSFDVTVDGGSWLSSLASTNNALRIINVVNGDLNGDGKVGTDTKTFNGQPAADQGNLFIGDGQRLTDNAVNDSLLFEGRDGLLADAAASSGLVDVKEFHAEQMTGKANISAAITDKSSEKYLGDTDQVDGLGNNFAPDGDFEYGFGANDDTLNMSIAGGVAADNDFNMVINMGGGNDSVRLEFAGNTSGNQNWEYNQWNLKNVQINTGDGNDIVNAYGTGHVLINTGNGSDIVYSDNSGVSTGVAGVGAVFVLNAVNDPSAKQIGIADGGIVPVQNDVASEYVSFGAAGLDATDGAVTVEVEVTYKGVSNTAQIRLPVAGTGANGSVSVDDLTLNQLIANAVNSGDSFLSGLLSAQEGAGHSLLLISKVDGLTSINDLQIDFSAWQGASAATGTVVNLVSDTLGNVALNTWYNSDDPAVGGHKDYANTDGLGIAEVTGNNSAAHADNIINLGAGNDMAVLGTGARSNDTIVINKTDNGDDTIVNFDLSQASTGRDYFDVTAAFDGADPDQVVFDFADLNNGAANNIMHSVLFYENAARDDADYVDSAAKLQSVLNAAGNTNPQNNSTLFMVYENGGDKAAFTMYLVNFSSTGVASVNSMSSVAFADFLGGVGGAGASDLQLFLDGLAAAVAADPDGLGMFNADNRLNNGVGANFPQDVRVVTDTSATYNANIAFQGEAAMFLDGSGIADANLKGYATEILLTDAMKVTDQLIDYTGGTAPAQANIQTIQLADALNVVEMGSASSNNALYDYKGGTGVDTFQDFAGSYDGRIDAGAGNDVFTVTAALDPKAVLNGDAGNDAFTLSGAFAATANGGAGNDTFTVTAALAATAVLNGDADDDTFTFSVAQTNAATVNGGAGNDTFTLGGTLTGFGSAKIDGGEGNDSVNITSTGNVSLTLGADLANVEAITVAATATGTLVLDLGAATAGMTVDASAKTSGAVTITKTSNFADDITLGTAAVTDTVTLTAATSGIDKYDSITNFSTAATGNDVLKVGAAVFSGTVTGWTISSGVATKGGATLEEFISVFSTSTSAGSVAWTDSTDTYLLTSDGNATATGDILVQLVGVTGVTDVDGVAAANTIVVSA